MHSTCRTVYISNYIFLNSQSYCITDGMHAIIYTQCIIIYIYTHAKLWQNRNSNYINFHINDWQQGIIIVHVVLGCLDTWQFFSLHCGTNYCGVGLTFELLQWENGVNKHISTLKSLCTIFYWDLRPCPTLSESSCSMGFMNTPMHANLPQ